ncbi:SCO family protein [Hydrogenophaga sp.]|uniref:SCO family protein n=1 Tax=Hydrogenophaga sp. TaxID=1904254 RepID=UPI00199AAAF1|nr:SCO family protein [Hydrogenophaga sp.]MBD3893484.1 SCO family protein [Hydrogenophaga sp.]
MSLDIQYGALILPRRRALAWFGVAALGVLLSACERPSASGAAAAFKGIDITGVPYGRALALTDQHGKPRTLADFHGQVVMLFFGFVQCPDVCPTALLRAAQVMQQLGPQAQQVQLLFVTLDPQRDTPELLRAYMAAFDPSFLALTGTAAQIRVVADEFRVYYKTVATATSYTIDHTAMTYLLDRQGRLRVALRHQQPTADYVADVRLLLAEPAV